MRRVADGIVLSWLLFSLPAVAGVEIETRTKQFDGDGRKTHLTIWVDGNRLVAEPRKASAPSSRRRIVYLAERDVMWFIDRDRQTYYQLDPESAETTAAQVSDLKEDLSAALEGLDPEIRGKAEGLLGKLETGEVDPLGEVDFRERGEVGSYADVACARYDLIAREKRVAEMCVADWAAAGAGAAVRPLVPALTKFLRTSFEPLARELPMVQPLLAWTALEDTPGLPLLTRTFSDGQPESETKVRGIRQVDVDAGRFELPEGYARSWVPPF